ncbi:MAG: hypothetical protein ACREM3_20755 [Candidatus Rokuibacteriota bacterium]
MGLRIALDTRAADALDQGAVAVHVSVAGGTAPLKLTLHLDGLPLGGWDSLADVYEFRLAPLTGRPRALTVRVVDADGQWGSRSAVVEGRPDARGDTIADAPRVTLRSSIRSRARATLA